MILFTLLHGCGSTVAKDVVAEQEQLDRVQLTPEWTPEKIFEQLDLLMSYGVPNPYPVLDRYMELYDEGGTPDCPGTNYNFDGADVDNAGCETDSGYFYAGLGELRQNDEGFDLHCDCRIVTPDGRMIRGAGNISVFNDDGFLMLDIRGSFLEVKNEYEGTWLEELPSISLSVMENNGDLFISGGYTINGISIYMENYMLEECSRRDGSIFIRDPSGGWWTWTTTASCTEGTLYFQETTYGTWSWNSTQLDEAVLAILEVQ